MLPSLPGSEPTELTAAELETFKQRFLAEVNRPDRWARARVLQPCPSCGRDVPIRIGREPRLCPGHSWWERAKLQLRRWWR